MTTKTFTLDIDLTPGELAECVACMDSGQQAEFFSGLAKEFSQFPVTGLNQIVKLVGNPKFTSEAREFLREILYWAGP